LPQIFLIAGALYGATGVAAGAFGAHALKTRMGAESLATWDTAVFYQLVHALGLLAVAGLMRVSYMSDPHASTTGYLVAGWGFIVGVLLFSGSLYGLTLGGPRLLGPITPIGGLALITGWFGLLYAALR
jgi:uncharacterized membrane protein YgdD (TMEM256/DUF423 family)